MQNKVLETLFFKLRDIYTREVGFIGTDSSLFTTVKMSPVKDIYGSVILLCDSISEKIIYKGYTFLHTTYNYDRFIVFCEGEDDEALKVAEVLLAASTGFMQSKNEKLDKNNFLKNVLLDNILPGDVYVRAKELDLPYEGNYATLIIRNSNSNKDFEAFDVVSAMFPENNRDFVINMDSNNIVLIKEIANTENSGLEEIAKSIDSTLKSETMQTATIGIGTVITDLRELSKSYKEAQVALEVGKVFDVEKTIVNYENLGIGRLIYQLPTTLCELFLSEVFKKDTIDSLDSETIHTIQQFFENNLNVSETARKLYVHRNTLVYRLDKVQKITGLDLRIFDHAIVFKVAMMVKKYLVTNPIKM